MLKLIILIVAFIGGYCQADPLNVIIFGASGDLSGRKLLPALYNLEQEGELPADFKVIGVGRGSEDQFYETAKHSLDQFSRQSPTTASWEEFKSHLTYQTGDFTQSRLYEALREQVKDEAPIFYLATPSAFFPIIIEFLHQNDLVKGAKIIIEKPFGEDFDSALALQSQISQRLDEEQIYRMDHYLGKEGVFKLEKFRLEDAPLDHYLNRDYVEKIEIILSETIGIGTRADFYEKTGHLRDVVQNHAIQILTFAAMDIPTTLTKEQEKSRVLRAIQPLHEVTRGQYLGYREEKGVAQDSVVETFMKAKIFIENERWQGVPFHLISGKKLAEQLTQVRYSFKANPLDLEAITIVVQPNPRILITRDGLTEPYLVDLDPKLERREAYENTLLAAIQGDRSRFATLDEVLIAWNLLTPILRAWVTDPIIPFYEAGTWGPES